MEKSIIMTIRKENSNKKQYIDLLLLADEQENMIDRYLERGDLYVMEEDGEVIAVAVVTREDDSVIELKNLAVSPSHQRKGVGRKMIRFIEERYSGHYQTLLVGTGDTPDTVTFYERCGFVRSHVLPDFFTLHYDHPVMEGGKQLRDMVYLKKTSTTNGFFSSSTTANY